MSNSGVFEHDYEREGDRDSLYTNPDSPADGYFERRPHPQQSFVEISSGTAEADAKAREAAQAGNSATRPPSHQASPTRSTPSFAWAEESTPLLDAGPAPPDYAAATGHRQSESRLQPSSSDDQRSASYGGVEAAPRDLSASERDDRPWPLGERGNPLHGSNSPFGSQGSPFDSNGAFGDCGPFARRGQPENMSNPPPAPASHLANTEADEEGGIPGPRRRMQQKPNKQSVRGCCKPMSVFKWCLIFAAAVLVFVLTGASRGTSGGTQGADERQKLPLKDGGGIGGGSSGGSGSDEGGTTPGPPNDTFPTHPHNSMCTWSYYSNTVALDFDSPGNFSFLELMEFESYIQMTVSGTVWVHPAPAEQEVDIRVWISYATTEPWRVDGMNLIKSDDALNLQFPNLNRVTDRPSDGMGCMDVGVAIEVKKGVVIDNWEIATTNLDVKVADNLFKDQHSTATIQPLHIGNETRITAVKGQVDMAYWSSRETRIDTTSGTVTGRYALRDLLYIKTQSGSVNVDVEPKKADPDRVVPAEFTALSSSGNVHAVFPTHGKLPDREYRTRVENESNGISGAYILGLMASFQTSSGSINAAVLPYDGEAVASSLRSESQSGRTTLEILPTHKNPGTAISRLHSFHKSSSGSLQLKYPQEWEGTIDGETLSGSIQVRGKDVHVDVDGRFGPMGKHIVARKGKGSSRLDFRTSSGSAKLVIGDE